ncbi:RelA/SpoT domain-containing protein [Oscillibacter hominis]|uniref:RelA/SpoT domain-containing protein n=1 Tax=Oscillibacter hominis TaxID=2763056 RepID=A0A7G9B6N8_9FIRM|nr:RelA/SpoT domain-containing protein [Oscillibacter hominis]QNL45219.1 RelA/SpoT domain-containing protein [Oscillibacter hominis]
MARWKEVEFSRSQIIKAGKTIRKTEASEEEIAQATTIINNWRAAHAYPLHVIYIHLRGMAANRQDIVVAERLKRLDSIVAKLKRQPTMSLWEMQDLGGCRFIVPTVPEVYQYAKKYKSSRIRHQYIETYDYIQSPKTSGYRSLHLVFRFNSDTKETYNRNMLIELQFRTHLQHVWATAVETIGLFTKQALKAGQGDAEIKRFFVLISSLFAIRENCPVVPNTLNEVNELIAEIEQINDDRHLLDMLKAIRVAVDHEEDERLDKKGYYILIFNYNTKRLRIKYFLPGDIEEANKMYSQIEATRADAQIDAVLVRAASFKSLKVAYPNYFLDIGEFVDIVMEYLG